MSWATGAQATALTGVTLTDANVAVAQPIIEIFAGTTQDADPDQSVRTLRLLRYAVSYQAAWQLNQIDVLTRTDVSALSQDGMSTTPGHEDALVLAPLAKRCLDQLPWRRSRSVQVGPPPGAGAPDQLDLARLNVVREQDDEDAHPWLPLYS